MIDSLEAENRLRMKRNQHPLTYQEAYNLLTQLLKGDVLGACHSANIHWNAYSMEEDGFVSNNHRGERNGNNQRGNQKGGRGGKGKSSSGRGKFSNRGKPYERKDDPVWAHCKEFNSASGCTTQNCTKKHTCSQRMGGGIICNQKTHGRTTHEAQYWLVTASSYNDYTFVSYIPQLLM